VLCRLNERYGGWRSQVSGTFNCFRAFLDRVMPRTCILSLVVAALCLSGCSRDPKVLCARFIESGNKYVAKSQYDAASIQFRRAVRANPNSAEAHYDLALSLGKLGRWTEAYRELQATTQVDPKHLAAHL